LDGVSEASFSVVGRGDFRGGDPHELQEGKESIPLTSKCV